MTTIDDVLKYLSCTLKGLQNITGAETEVRRLLKLGWSAEAIAREIARLFPTISFRPEHKPEPRRAPGGPSMGF